MGETHVNEEKSLTDLMGEVKPKEKKHSTDRLEGMRKKTDLSDIILEKENSTNARNKKLVLGAASLILLFLVFLIISKILNSNADVFTSTDGENKQETVKNDKIVKEETEIKKVLDEKKNDTIKENSTKKVKNANDTDLKFEEMVKKLREEDAKENNTEVVKVVTPPTEKKEDTKQPKVEIIKDKPAITQKPDNSKKIVITEAKKTDIVKKPSVKKPIKRPNPNLIFGQNSGYYIQVGATTTPNPNKTLVSKISSNGYSYITHPIVVKGRKFYKVLIGPYNSKAEAVNKLPRVKATINPKAFLYHLR